MEALNVQTIKGYELREEIGRGAFGVIYRAYQSLVGREVAIKAIHARYANEPEFIRRFEAEAHMVAQLEHPHIVPLYDYWREPDGAYLVMRWLRGGNLHDKILAGDFLSTEAFLQVIDQIGTALMVAHRHGVVHRDLKPANILLDEDGNAYLADFGIAKDVGDPEALRLTRPGVVVGSPAYIAPEQILAQQVTSKTDIYSLGIMLYEILTGELPFWDLTPTAIFFKHLHEPLPSIHTRRPDLPAGLDDIIQRATAKDPTDRYPDVLSLVKDIHRVLVLGNKAGPAQAPMTSSTPGATIPGHDSSPATSTSVEVPSPYETAVLHVPSALDVPVSPIQNPYKGLRAFQEADAADFFGRAALTQRLLARLGDPTALSRFLAVVGPSGSGKSSVVRAGLVPALRDGALSDLGSSFVVEMFPGANPLHELEITLRRVAVNWPDNLNDQLQDDEHGLLRVIQQVLPDNSETELVLVIDQFEEIFTLVADERTRTHFMDSLLTALTDPNSRLRVIITLRADFYDRPLLYGGFGELMRLRTEVVLPLTSEELCQAIVNPAERVGVRPDPELVATIVHDVNEQPGTLPLLQYALTELFERRTGHQLTLAAYNASGGVRGALARRAGQLYSELDQQEQEAAQQLFLRLVTLGEGTEDTRRRVPRTELTSIVGAGSALDHVINVYHAHRLLTFDRDPVTRGPTVEIAHEALIRTWRRLQEWLDISRDDLRRQQRLARWAAEWMKADRDPSFLASGMRLEQFATWVAGSHVALNQDEQAYLDASLAEREAQRAQEAARKAREAHLERRSRQVLRALVVVLLLATLGALGLTGVALNQRQGAQNNAAAAATAQAQALMEANHAENNAAAAATAQAQALMEANHAENNAAAAATAQAQALTTAAEAQNVALWAGAQAALSQGNTDLALALAMTANRSNQPLKQAQLILADAAYAPGTRHRFTGPTSGVSSVAFSPNGKTALSASDDGTVILWDLTTGQVIRTLKGHSAGVRGVAFSPDGKTALSASDDGTVILWDLTTGQVIRTLTGHTQEVYGVAFSPDGKTALSASADKTLILWDLATGHVIRTFTGHTQEVYSVAFSPDGTTAFSGSADTSAILWDVATGQAIRHFEGHTKEIFSVAFSPDGKTALSGSADTSVILWDLATGKEIHRFKGHTREVRSVTFSPDGTTALSGSQDNRLGLWDVKSGDPIRFLTGHGASVRAAVFSPDGHRILSGSVDNTLRLWDLASGAEIQRFTGHTNGVWRVAFSPDGRTILSASLDTTLILWDVATGKQIRRFAGHAAEVNSVAFSPDGKTAISGSGDKTLILWDIATGQFLRIFKGHTDGVGPVAFSPDGRTVLSGSQDKTLILWDIATGQAIRTFRGHTQMVRTVAYSPDARTALSGSGDGTLILWDLATGQIIRTLKGHSAGVRGVAFSPDGKTAISGSEDKTLILWDVASGKQIRHFVEHISAVQSVVFSPDGKTVLSGAVDTTMILWDVATGQAIRRFVGHSAAVRDVAFSPDGHKAVSASLDKTLRLWRIDSLEELLDWTKDNRYVPDLTCDQRELYRLEPCGEMSATPTPTR